MPSGTANTYTDREIEAHMSEIKSMFKEHALDDHKSFGDIKEAIEGLTVEVKKTNGSVIEINRWRERMNGGALVAGFFTTIIVVPVLTWAIYVLVNIQDTIHKSVNEALSAYELKL